MKERCEARDAGKGSKHEKTSRGTEEQLALKNCVDEITCEVSRLIKETLGKVSWLMFRYLH